MDVVSLSPLSVASLRWYDRYSRPVLTFVCRATFALAPGESRLADHQEAPSEHDNHWDDDPSRSVVAPSDLVPLKPRADVVLVGSAFAPRGERVRALRTRLIVGEIDKSIEVFGERVFAQDGSLREGARFSKMALRYERAAGGPSTANPVGVSPEVADTFGQVALPNLQTPGIEVTSARDFIDTVGYGPVAPSWPERREKLRSNAQAFVAGAWSSQALPDDVDLGFFNAAPRDQQIEALRDNERIVLENLHPEIPRLVTSLPGIHPRAFAEIPGSAPRELTMVCDTLWINTDSALCTLTWRGQLAIERNDGRVFIVMEQPGQRATWDDVERLRPRNDATPRALSDGSTSIPQPRAALPFMKVDASPSSMPNTPMSAPMPSGPPRGAQTMDVSALQQMAQALDASPSWLASQQGAPAASPRPAPTPPRPPPISQAHPAPPEPPPLPRAVAMTPSAPPAPPRVAPPRPTQAPIAPAIVQAVAVPALVQSAPAIPAPVTPVTPITPAAPPEPSLRAKPIAPGGRLAAPSAPSALAASNAAIVREERPERSLSTPRAEAALPASRMTPGEYVDLVWLDPDGLARARTHKPLYPLFAPEKKAVEAWLDDGPSLKIGQDQRDRADALRVLTRSRALDDAGLTQAMIDAVSDEGTFSAPIAVVGGELHFRFDEIETLKVMVVVLAPLAVADKKLKDLCDAASEVLRSSWSSSGSGVAEAMTARMREAFVQQNRSLPANYLDRTVDRVLLEQRRYQKRTVLGAEMIRALLLAPGGSAPVPTYLPASMGSKLPLFPSFKVHVLASVLATQDQSEAHAAALEVVALGRVLPVAAAPGRAR